MHLQCTFRIWGHTLRTKSLKKHESMFVVAMFFSNVHTTRGKQEVKQSGSTKPVWEKKQFWGQRDKPRHSWVTRTKAFFLWPYLDKQSTENLPASKSDIPVSLACCSLRSDSNLARSESSLRMCLSTLRKKIKIMVNTFLHK